MLVVIYRIFDLNLLKLFGSLYNARQLSLYYLYIDRFKN